MLTNNIICKYIILLKQFKNKIEMLNNRIINGK